MNNYFSLLKVECLSQFGLNKILHSKKSKRLSGLSGIIVFALLMIGLIGFMGYTYSNVFAFMLSSTGRIDELLPIMIAVSCLVSFFLSFYTSSGVLYGYKDYDLLMSMPIKQSAIVLSKLTFIYVFDLVFAICVVVPAFIVYGGFATLTAGMVISVVVMVVFSPLLPTALSLFLGALIAFISSRFRKKNIAQMILYLFVFLLCFGMGFLTGSGEIDYTAIIGKIYFIMPWAIKATSEILYLALYVLINVAPFILIAVICALTYKKMNTLITAKKRTKEFRLKSYGGKTKFGALLSREVNKLFSIAIYAMNTLMGPILGMVITIAIAVLFRTTFGGYVGEISVFIPAIFAFMFMMAPTTNCSISLEGKSYWIIKTAPISAKDLFSAKLMVNVLFGVAPAFVSGLVSTIILGAPYYEVILITAMAAAIALLGGGLGFLANLMFPTMNWEHESKPVKQGLPVFMTMLFAMFFAGGFFAIAFFVPIAYIYNMLIIFAVVIVLNVVVYTLIYTKGEKLLSKIN